MIRSKETERQKPWALLSNNNKNKKEVKKRGSYFNRKNNEERMNETAYTVSNTTRIRSTKKGRFLQIIQGMERETLEYKEMFSLE